MFFFVFLQALILYTQMNWKVGFCLCRIASPFLQKQTFQFICVYSQFFNSAVYIVLGFKKIHVLIE